MKQSKLRRRRVTRYLIAYIAILVLFLALLVGPIVGGSKISGSLTSLVPDTGIFVGLLQPTNQTHNDTGPSYVTTTGTGATATASASAAAGKI
jgi:1,3-beta-glucan synthase